MGDILKSPIYKTAALGIPNKNEIRSGSRVQIETKQNQGKGKLTGGIVLDILTNSKTHPHGIKVRLEDGQVGRVKKICSMGTD